MSRAGAVVVAVVGTAVVAFTLAPSGSNTVVIPQQAAAEQPAPAGGPVSMDNLSPAWAQVPQDMRPHFFTAGQKSGCALATPWLLAAVAEKESGFNRMAVSSAGARGVMQIMPNTQKAANVTDPFDPAQAIPGAARVLCAKEKATRNRSSAPLLVRTLAAYNGGEGNVGRTIPVGMQRYAEDVIAAMDKYSRAPATDTPATGTPNPASGTVPLPEAAGYQKMEAALHKAFPKARITSRFRPGAITSSGNRSYHSMGRALDIEPNKAIFEWLVANYGDSREIIFTPMGARQIKNGKPHNGAYRGRVAADHTDHIHWAR